MLAVFLHSFAHAQFGPWLKTSLVWSSKDIHKVLNYNLNNGFCHFLMEHSDKKYDFLFTSYLFCDMILCIS